MGEARGKGGEKEKEMQEGRGKGEVDVRRVKRVEREYEGEKERRGECVWGKKGRSEV